MTIDQYDDEDDGVLLVECEHCGQLTLDDDTDTCHNASCPANEELYEAAMMLEEQRRGRPTPANDECIICGEAPVDSGGDFCAACHEKGEALMATLEDEEEDDGELTPGDERLVERGVEVAMKVFHERRPSGAEDGNDEAN